ncbi:MAG: hypothetical protein ABSF90_07120 [Syntrophobacteraceae bacterium]|jgi:hypothetical protein
MATPQVIQYCNFEGKAYSEDSEICALLRCTICKNGQWEDLQSYGLAALVVQPFCRGIRLI